MLSSVASWLQPGETSGILFYPAAGFDWKLPLALTRLCQRQANLPGFDMAIYVDYSTQLSQQLAAAWASGDSLYWGPDVRAHIVSAIRPPAGMVWKLRSCGHHAPEGGSLTSDYWYLLDLYLPRFILPILYVPADAVAFVTQVIAPLDIRPTYVATVTDGCRQGGNWCCLSKRQSPFYMALKESGMLPDYWLTDHGDLNLPVMAKIGTGIYGRGESSLMAIN